MNNFNSINAKVFLIIFLFLETQGCSKSQVNNSDNKRAKVIQDIKPSAISNHRMTPSIKKEDKYIKIKFYRLSESEKESHPSFDVWNYSSVHFTDDKHLIRIVLDDNVEFWDIKRKKLIFAKKLQTPSGKIIDNIANIIPLSKDRYIIGNWKKIFEFTKKSLFEKKHPRAIRSMKVSECRINSIEKISGSKLFILNQGCFSRGHVSPIKIVDLKKKKIYCDITKDQIDTYNTPTAVLLNKRLFAASTLNGIEIWGVNSCRKKMDLLSISRPNTGGILFVDKSENTLYCNFNKEIRSYNFVTHKKTTLPFRNVYSIDIWNSSKNKMLVLGDKDEKTIRLYDVKKKKIVRQFKFNQKLVLYTTVKGDWFISQNMYFMAFLNLKTFEHFILFRDKML